MKVAIAQIDIIWEDKFENEKKCSQFIFEANQNGCGIIIFPEMTLTGFSMNVEGISEFVHKSLTVSFFKKQAIKNNILIMFGFIEYKSGEYFNKCICINSEGKIVSDYSKIHTFSIADESKKISKGDKLSYFQKDNITFSTFICYDLRFPEIFQICSNRADVITVIANWPKERINQWEILLKARAIESQCYIIGVNRVGVGNHIDYNGISVIVNPYGEIITEITSDESIIIGEILKSEVSKIKKNFPYKKDRNSKLYENL